jgi:hypothetical protein
MVDDHHIYGGLHWHQFQSQLLLGRLGDIQQTGSAPSSYKPSASYNYGVGGFLLAGSELHKLAAHK